MGFRVQSGGEVQRIGVASVRRGRRSIYDAVAEDDLPETDVAAGSARAGVLGEDGSAGGIGDLAEVGVGVGVVDVDEAVAEIADEQVAAIDAEAGR